MSSYRSESAGGGGGGGSGGGGYGRYRDRERERDRDRDNNNSRDRDRGDRDRVRDRDRSGGGDNRDRYGGGGGSGNGGNGGGRTGRFERYRFGNRGPRNYSPPRRAPPANNISGNSSPSSSSRSSHNDNNKYGRNSFGLKHEYSSNSNSRFSPPNSLRKGDQGPHGPNIHESGGFFGIEQLNSHQDASSCLNHNNYYNNHHDPNVLPPHGLPLPPQSIHVGSLEQQSQPGMQQQQPGVYVPGGPPYFGFAPSYLHQQRHSYVNGAVDSGMPPKPKKPKKEPPDINNVVDGVISQLKIKGIFDKFRRECLSESDTKPSYITLNRRVTDFVEGFLRGLIWSPGFQKNAQRNQMRSFVEGQTFFRPGIETIIEQCLRGKMSSDFIPVIEEETFAFMGCNKDGKKEKDNNKADEKTEVNGVKSSHDELPQHFKKSDFGQQQQQHPPFTPAPPPPPTNPPPPPPPEDNFYTSRRTPPYPPPPDERSQRNVNITSQSNGWNDEAKDDVEMETCSYEDEEFVEEEESEDESPMFEKIAEVSPPRAVFLDVTEDEIRELNSKLFKPKTPEEEVPVPTPLTASRDECKFLEPPSLLKEKLAYYKHLPERSGLDK